MAIPKRKSDPIRAARHVLNKNSAWCRAPIEPLTIIQQSEIELIEVDPGSTLISFCCNNYYWHIYNILEASIRK